MAKQHNNLTRPMWGSRLGFILAAAGSATGLGNIWKSPYIAGNNGGGAFVLVYLISAAGDSGPGARVPHVSPMVLTLLWHNKRVRRRAGAPPRALGSFRHFTNSRSFMGRKFGMSGVPWAVNILGQPQMAPGTVPVLLNIYP